MEHQIVKSERKSMGAVAYCVSAGGVIGYPPTSISANSMFAIQATQCR